MVLGRCAATMAVNMLDLFSTASTTAKGCMQYPTGDVYEGQFENGEGNGQAVFTYATGEVWVGEYKEGNSWIGSGAIKFKDGGTFFGTLLDGKSHGQWRLVHAGGNVYEGGFAEGEMHGQGVFTYAAGGKWEGEFQAGKKSETKHELLQ